MASDEPEAAGRRRWFRILGSAHDTKNPQTTGEQADVEADPEPGSGASIPGPDGAAAPAVAVVHEPAPEVETPVAGEHDSDALEEGLEPGPDVEVPDSEVS